MVTIQLTREFILEEGNSNMTLPDPNPGFTSQEVLDFYSGQYPQLTTATCSGPTISDDKEIYTFSTVLGMKG